MDEDDGLQCSFHPYRTNNGGICALCLQEKLGKLVSSPSSVPVYGSSSSSYSSPAFRSDSVTVDFVKKKKTSMVSGAPSIIHEAHPIGSGDNKLLVAGAPAPTAGKPTRFWRFLRISKPMTSTMVKDKEKNAVVLIQNEKPLDRKISRSRSLGCGSRSFSGEFLERISSGLGDCTLRRVESHRESKSKSAIKARIKCGNIFNGFTMTSSSSTSSSSSYWMPSVPEYSNGKSGAVVSGNRSRSWGWTFASPMRAFNKSSSSKEDSTNSKATPNLSGNPSILTVR